MQTTVTLIAAAAMAFAFAAAAGPIAIPFLRRLKFGQSIREDGPKWHKGKAGTPTMGGFIFILASTLSALLLLFRTDAKEGVILPLLAAISFAAVGFADDYIKVVKKRNLGLTSRQKLLMQLLCGLALIAALDIAGLLRTTLYIPFVNVEWDMGIFYYPFALFAITAIVNAVNLTDGIDGLAASVTIPAAGTLLAVALMLGFEGPAIYMAALIGALAGFLIFNLHPAKVFMGDTGALFIGGAIAAVCFMINLPLLFLLIGFIYLLETLSVSLQVLYFKATHGKRLFKMAPFHHHLELCGWSENKIVVFFVLVTVLTCILGYTGVVNYMRV